MKDVKLTNEFKKELLSAFKETKTFIVKQTPGFANEIVLAHKMACIISLIFTGFLEISFIASYFLMSDTTGKTCSLILALFNLFIIVSSTKKLFETIYTPKLVVIEYIADLVKGDDGKE